ncbi:MAG: quinate 5-dehydrogenase [Deinococcota bacterium]
MKHIVSVSLGHPARDAVRETEILGEQVKLERIGVNGDFAKAASLIQDLDGKVDAIGLGGIILHAYIDGRRYTIRDAAKLASHAPNTPVVCGAGLKTYLEAEVVRRLDDQFNWQGKRVLVTSAVDRYSMAEAFIAAGAQVTLGDLAFAVGIPIGIRNIMLFNNLAKAALPIAFRLPFQLLYPTGQQQSEAAPPAKKLERFRKFYDQAEVIAGDWHYVRQYLPTDLTDKIIVTNTNTEQNLIDLQARGVSSVITTTPRLEGRSVAVNVLEAALAAVRGFPIQVADYKALASSLEPDVYIT